MAQDQNGKELRTGDRVTFKNIGGQKREATILNIFNSHGKTLAYIEAKGITTYTVNLQPDKLERIEIGLFDESEKLDFQPPKVEKKDPGAFFQWGPHHRGKEMGR